MGNEWNEGLARSQKTPSVLKWVGLNGRKQKSFCCPIPGDHEIPKLQLVHTPSFTFQSLFCNYVWRTLFGWLGNNKILSSYFSLYLPACFNIRRLRSRLGNYFFMILISKRAFLLNFKFSFIFLFLFSHLLF